MRAGKATSRPGERREMARDASAGKLSARTRIQFVQQYTPVLASPTGERYVAQAYMDRQPGGLWEAWLVFFSLETGAAFATDRETAQSTRAHSIHWPTGLGETYLVGALERALTLTPEAELARRGARAEQREAYALAEARVYTAAVAGALRTAQRARARPGGRRRAAGIRSAGRAARDRA